MAGKPKIGVLALQGAFAKHIEKLNQVGGQPIEVRRPEQLEQCDGLVLPGGESTTMIRQMHFFGFLDPIQAFGKIKPILGTCAGLILMAKEVAEESLLSFGFLDITVERNAYGRQTESFQQDISLNDSPCSAVFIRAPRILHCSDSVSVLATLDDEPICVQQGLHIGAAFHPELTENTQLHQHFTDIVKCKGIGIQ